MIDKDNNVLREVINIQKKIIENFDSHITRLELLLNKNNIEKNNKENLDLLEKDKEIIKLRNQVDSLISILVDQKINSKNTVKNIENNTQKITEIKQNNKNQDKTKMEIKTNPILNSSTNVVVTHGMSFMDELKNKLKNSKYEVDIDN
ncbi:hypothetical protein CL656_05635 [bacterium]|nr:hypothetical protein [bacterium]|tara:strand:+ start:2665 stop:3108 length:444 start_codon:yes stop_codon:yes gene_type:complete